MIFSFSLSLNRIKSICRRNSTRIVLKSIIHRTVLRSINGSSLIIIGMILKSIICRAGP